MITLFLIILVLVLVFKFLFGMMDFTFGLLGALIPYIVVLFVVLAILGFFLS